MAIPFPDIDPVALSLGPLKIRWYALAYLAGFLLGWRYVLMLAQRMLAARGHMLTAKTWPATARPHADDFSDLLSWLVIGVIAGGRLGYVLFYNWAHYAANPTDMLMIWHGGMSFHGGFLGASLAMILFARRRGLRVLTIADLVAAAAPIGLFFGRIANFVNGELFGRFSDLPWAMAFPQGGPLPRHPSQLYQAGLEGIVLGCVLALLAWPKGRALDRPGLLSGVFLAGYGLCRIVGELFREPDAQIGFLSFGITMGQILSTPMIVAGVGLILFGHRSKWLTYGPKETVPFDEAPPLDDHAATSPALAAKGTSEHVDAG